MSEREKQLLEGITEAIPLMTKRQQDYLLGYGEAIIRMGNEEEKNEHTTDDNHS